MTISTISLFLPFRYEYRSREVWFVCHIIYGCYQVKFFQSTQLRLNVETRLRLKQEIKTKTVQIKTGNYNRELEQETRLRLKQRLLIRLHWTILYSTSVRKPFCLKAYNKLLRLERTTNKKFKPLLPSSKKYGHWRLTFMKIWYVKCRISLPNLVHNEFAHS